MLVAWNENIFHIKYKQKHVPGWSLINVAIRVLTTKQYHGANNRGGIINKTSTGTSLIIL